VDRSRKVLRYLWVVRQETTEAIVETPIHAFLQAVRQLSFAKRMQRTYAPYVRDVRNIQQAG